MEVALNKVSIRVPRPAERPACRMLLPQLAGGAVRFVVAVDEEGGQILGAASLAWDAALGELKGWEMDVHVVPPARGRGIGRSLANELLARSQAEGIRRVHAKDWVTPGGAAERFWMALGFAAGQRKFEYEGAFADCVAAFAPLNEQLRSSGWIPESARVVPLREADPAAIARLHVQHLGGTLAALMPLLTGAGPQPYDREMSFALLVDNQVVGFTLGRIHRPQSLCIFDATVIDPALRSGWATLYLRYEAACRILAGGIQTVRYYALEGASDTKQVHRRIRSRLVGTTVCMERVAEPGSGSAPA